METTSDNQVLNTPKKVYTSEKNKKIAESRKKTLEKRKSQQAIVIDLKIQTNKLNKLQKEAIETAFLNAKWLSNDIIGCEDVFAYEIPKSEVDVLVKDSEGNSHWETRELKFLGSQVKQSVLSGVEKSTLELLTVLSTFLRM